MPRIAFFALCSLFALLPIPSYATPIQYTLSGTWSRIPNTAAPNDWQFVDATFTFSFALDSAQTPVDTTSFSPYQVAGFAFNDGSITIAGLGA